MFGACPDCCIITSNLYCEKCGSSTRQFEFEDEALQHLSECMVEQSNELIEKSINFCNEALIKRRYRCKRQISHVELCELIEKSHIGELSDREKLIVNRARHIISCY
jgi:hypothetical protein